MVFHHYGSGWHATSIQGAKIRHAEDFRKAEIGLTDSDEGIDIPKAMLQFLDMDGMAPYYKYHANIILASHTEGMTMKESIKTSKSYFQAAGTALAEAKFLYVEEASDEEELKGMQEHLEGENAAMDSLEASVKRDGDWNQILPIHEPDDTIKVGINRFERIFREASTQLPHEDAQDFVRRIKAHREGLLINPFTPPDYRCKAHLFLCTLEPTSADPKKFLKESRTHVEAAMKEFKKAKELFVVDPEDKERLEFLATFVGKDEDFYRNRYEEVYGVAPAVNGDEIREDI